MTKHSERHVPVLLKQAIEFLNLRAGATVADCTLGMAGHSSQIAEVIGPTGHLIGFDRDPEALELAKLRLAQVANELGNKAPQITLIGEAFSSISRHVEPASLDAILADFGISSLQLDEARRGFSFMADGHLDMRMDTRSGTTAEQVVNEVSERELANLIYEYGDERRSRRIARAIVQRERPISNNRATCPHCCSSRPGNETGQNSSGDLERFKLSLHIRKLVELDEIRALLEAAPTLLKPSGRLVVISFHSLEDRIAKDSLREGARQKIWGSSDKEADNTRRRRDRTQPALTQREVESSRKTVGSW